MYKCVECGKRIDVPSNVAKCIDCVLKPRTEAYKKEDTDKKSKEAELAQKKAAEARKWNEESNIEQQRITEERMRQDPDYIKKLEIKRKLLIEHGFTDFTGGLWIKDQKEYPYKRYKIDGVNTMTVEKIYEFIESYLDDLEKYRQQQVDRVTRDIAFKEDWKGKWDEYYAEKRKNQKEPHVDAMSKRVPGSFGTGKR